MIKKKKKPGCEKVLYSLKLHNIILVVNKVNIYLFIKWKLWNVIIYS